MPTHTGHTIKGISPVAHSFVPLGICKVQLDPVCEDGQPDATRQPLVVCNVTNIDINTRLTDGFTIEDPSGIPGQNCIELELPGSKRPPEVVIDTCNVYDPIFDSIASACNDVFTNAAGDIVGVAAKAKEGADCLCSCEENEEPCNRWDMTVWQLAYCPGSSGSRPEEGKFAVYRFPNLEFKPQTQTVSLTNELGGSRQYLATAYEPTGVGYAGPGDITPVELPFTSCQIGPFLSDVCPPGECGCGGCDHEDAVPLAGARAGRRRAAIAVDTAPAADIPDAAELVNA